MSTYPTKRNSSGIVICAICTPFAHHELLHAKALSIKDGTATEDVQAELEGLRNIFGSVGILRGEVALDSPQMLRLHHNEKCQRTTPTAPCDCTDRGCRYHRGFAWCNKTASEIVYRVDMEDLDGTLMCGPCAADAYESGVFTNEAPKTEFLDKLFMVLRDAGAEDIDLP